jgi:hypothetical protein
VHDETFSVSQWRFVREETVQQTASEEPGFTGTYPGAMKQSVSTALK